MQGDCDVCGKEKTWIEPLQSEYATNEVKVVCSDCLRILNSHFDDIRRLQRKILFTWMKRFIMSLREKLRG